MIKDRLKLVLKCLLCLHKFITGKYRTVDGEGRGISPVDLKGYKYCDPGSVL